jgi:hypothetical protein
MEDHAKTLPTEDALAGRSSGLRLCSKTGFIMLTEYVIISGFKLGSLTDGYDRELLLDLPVKP